MNIAVLYKTVLHSRESYIHWFKPHSLIPIQKNCPESSYPCSMILIEVLLEDVVGIAKIMGKKTYQKKEKKEKQLSLKYLMAHGSLKLELAHKS